MKTLIIYSSTYKGHTERVAQAMAAKIDADLLDLKKLKDFDFQSERYGLIGLGSGVYEESLSPWLHKWLEQSELRGKNVFVFSTSGVGLKLYNRALIKQLRAKGAIIRGSFACKGHFVAKEFTKHRVFEWLSRFAEGHPDDNDFAAAKKFISGLVADLQP